MNSWLEQSETDEPLSEFDEHQIRLLCETLNIDYEGFDDNARQELVDTIQEDRSR